MKEVSLGTTETGEDVSVDLEKDGIRFILLVGATGSGKSVFHTHLYRAFMDTYSPVELGFVFMDMTRVDFNDWDYRYLIRPTLTDPDEALHVLESLKDEVRMIVVHIEECDMVYRDRVRFERALDHILNENKNIFVVFSTSRIDPAYLTDWMEKYIDMKVVFRLATEEDSELLIGSDAAFLFREPGERMLVYGDKLIKCVPL